jgi:hypothetical protein
MRILRVSEILEIVGLDFLEQETSQQNDLTLGEKMFLFDSVRLRKLDRQQRVYDKRS